MRHSRQGLTGYCKVEMAIAKRLLQAALNLPLTIPHNRRSRIKTIHRSRQVENRFMVRSGPRERIVGFSRVEERKTGMMSGGICTKRYGLVARPTCETVHFRTHVPGSDLAMTYFTLTRTLRGWRCSDCFTDPFTFI